MTIVCTHGIDTYYNVCPQCVADETCKLHNEYCCPICSVVYCGTCGKRSLSGAPCDGDSVRCQGKVDMHGSDVCVQCYSKFIYGYGCVNGDCVRYGGETITNKELHTRFQEELYQSGDQKYWYTEYTAYVSFDAYKKKLWSFSKYDNYGYSWGIFYAYAK